jgi:ADP-ribose pyrophosphatase
MKYKIKSKKLLIDEYFQVEKASVEFDQHYADQPVEVERFNLLRGFAVCTLIYHKEKEAIIMVRQFRYSTAEAGYPWLLELPAGLANRDEDVVLAAKRETLEETGYQVSDLAEIKRFFVAPGCTDEMIILYYGEVTEKERLTGGGGMDDENEDIKLFFLPVSELPDYIRDNKTVDAKSLIGFYWYLYDKKYSLK